MEKPMVRKEAEEPTRATATTPTQARSSEKLDEAIKAVYRKYGTDLPAFFRDAFREAARKSDKAKAASASAEVHPL